MGSFVDRIRALALALGAPGLFLIAFLDSSFLSLPEIADIIVVYMVTRQKHLAVLYVLAATSGSLAGCLVLYSIGLKGGEKVVRKRFAGATTERAMALARKHGVMTVLIPSMLPPPMPFKIFVLLAGVVGITPGKFATAIVIGRGARYSLLAVLAIQYGDRALAYMKEHAIGIALGTLAVLLVALAVYVWWSKARARKTR